VQARHQFLSRAALFYPHTFSLPLFSALFFSSLFLPQSSSPPSLHRVAHTHKYKQGSTLSLCYIFLLFLTSSSARNILHAPLHGPRTLLDSPCSPLHNNLFPFSIFFTTVDHRPSLLLRGCHRPRLRTSSCRLHLSPIFIFLSFVDCAPRHPVQGRNRLRPWHFLQDSLPKAHPLLRYRPHSHSSSPRPTQSWSIIIVVVNRSISHLHLLHGRRRYSEASSPLSQPTPPTVLPIRRPNLYPH
jgi:hypothetical protein